MGWGSQPDMDMGWQMGWMDEPEEEADPVDVAIDLAMGRKEPDMWDYDDLEEEEEEMNWWDSDMGLDVGAWGY